MSDDDRTMAEVYIIIRKDDDLQCRAYLFSTLCGFLFRSRSFPRGMELRAYEIAYRWAMEHGYEDQKSKR